MGFKNPLYILMGRANPFKFRLPIILDQLNFYRGLAIIFGVGLIGHLLAPVRPAMLALTPYVLFITAVIVTHPLVRRRDYRTLSWLVTVAIFTFTMEVVGVRTGQIFGHYYYTDRLGLALFDVPLIIAINWALVVWGAICVAQRLFHRPWLIVVTSTAITVIFDIALEPTAIVFDYWRWPNDRVPLQNYIAWGGLSALSTLLYIALKCRANDRLPAFNLLVMFVYFLVLSLGLNH